MGFLFYDILLFIIFCAVVAAFLYKNKKNVKRDGIMFLYKSKFGIKIIDSIANKNRKFLSFISNIVIATGFIGMIVTLALLIISCYKMIIMPEIMKTPPVVPLLPWIPFPGLPTLYFTYWIIAIFILAVVHEGCHGIFSRLNKIKIKSTGFGFLGPLPLAFVEPDEKQVGKSSAKAQLSVFAAGPVSNFIMAVLVILVISFAVTPFYANVLMNSNIVAAQLNETGPAYKEGIRQGDMLKIGNVSTLKEFIEFQMTLKPNQTLIIETQNKTYTIITEKSSSNESAGYMGIGIKPKLEGINKGMPYVSALFFWIFITNFFVGLCNLIPLPVVDGGRMVYTAAFAITKSKKKAGKIAKILYTFSLFLFFLMFAIWIVRML